MSGQPGALARRLPWLLLLVVVGVALAIGSGAGQGRTLDDRVQSIALTIKCPQCSGQSSATSEASTAVAIRQDIAVRLRRGEDADQIRDYYAGRYGETILLNPGRSGSASLVWILPVVALVGAFGGLALAFRRWRVATPEAATEDDRRLVDAAQRGVFPAATDAPDPSAEPVAAGALDPHGEGGGR